ncbi:hypothetical protein [Rossellomorea aquimaris]|uniref:hypothetical protein n=1 Tax=Rossellomorea aquimaris TaxID=189382 RepID=UPI0007D061F3|nr:hypothetical protein [Rossellomorea aquimaris]
MNAFKGLLWKDYQTSKIWFVGWLAIIFLIYVIGIVIGNVVNNPSVVIFFLIMIGVFHIAVLPTIVVSMLKLEGNTQLWLHTPQNGFTLIISKIMIAFLYSTLSLFVVDGLGMISLALFPENGLFSYWPFKEGVSFNLVVTTVALYFSVWTIFFWTLYHALNKYPLIKNIRWMVIIGFIIVYQSIISFFMSLKWVQKLFFERFTINVNSGLFFTIGPGEAEFGMNAEIIPMPMLPFIFEGFVMITLFIISCWLLDRKVEV